MKDAESDRKEGQASARTATHFCTFIIIRKSVQNPSNITLEVWLFFIHIRPHETEDNGPMAKMYNV